MGPFNSTWGGDEVYVSIWPGVWAGGLAEDPPQVGVGAGIPILQSKPESAQPVQQYSAAQYITGPMVNLFSKYSITCMKKYNLCTLQNIKNTNTVIVGADT